MKIIIKLNLLGILVVSIIRLILFKKSVMKTMIIMNTVLVILKMMSMAETLWKLFLGHQNMEQILFLVSFSNNKGENNNGRIIC